MKPRKKYWLIVWVPGLYSKTYGEVMLQAVSVWTPTASNEPLAPSA